MSKQTPLIISFNSHARHAKQPQMYFGLTSDRDEMTWFIKSPFEFDGGEVIRYHFGCGLMKCAGCNLYAEEKYFKVSHRNAEVTIPQCPSCWREFIMAIETQGVDTYLDHKHSFEKNNSKQ